MMRLSPFSALSAFVAALLLPCFWASQSTAANADRPRKPSYTASDLEMLALAKIPPDAASLNIELLNCDFLLVHEKRSDIEVRANYPGHWRFDSSGLVRQTDIAHCYPGFYHTSNGNNLLGMGTVPAPAPAEQFCINITGRGIYMGGKKMPVESKVSRPGSLGFDLNETGMFVDGRRVKPMRIRGSDLEVDTVKILVPENFQGALNLTWKGSLPAKMDYWQGKCKLLISGRGEFTVGQISNSELLVDSGGRLRIHEFRASGNRSLIKCVHSGQLFLELVESPALVLASADSARIDVARGRIGKLQASFAGRSRLSLGAGTLETKTALRLGQCELKLADKSEAMVAASRIGGLKVSSAAGARARICALSLDRFQAEGGVCGALELLLLRQGQGED